jgi:hypothetical protein
METLIVSVKDKAEMKLVSDMLKKMRIETKILNDEEKEDIGMIKLLKKVDREDKVSRKKVMDKLGQE